MRNMKSVLLIGLGKFGCHTAMKLNELGHQVMAVDENPERVERVLSYVDNGQIGNSTDEEFLRSLGVRNFDFCIVAIGKNFQASLETTSLLKELGAGMVVSLADSEVHAKFLRKLGADEVVYPEKQLANWTAIRYSSDHIFDYIELGQEFAIFEVAIPSSWIGLTVGELDIRKKYNINIMALLGEYALALENDKILREKEAVALRAQNERLRANLLRSISYDLRTPLTSISGNASILMSDGDHFDEETKHQLYTDIYDDSIWLIELVENLLAISKIEDNHMNMQFTTEVLDEVLMAALEHVDRRKSEHRMVVNNSDELLLIKMDARLIVQVIINVVNNAIKYTQQGSVITISTEKQGDKAIIQIADNGPGVGDDEKDRIFEMFYCGSGQSADSQRSLGLGLALCKSIITAHGGEISVSDNVPCGAIFTITLPLEEVSIHE